MNRKLIQLVVLLLLGACMQAQAAGRNEHSNRGQKSSSEQRIVTQNCDGSMPELMQQMIKYYIDRGDFDSADALLQVAKKYQNGAQTQPIKIPCTKQEESHQTKVPRSNQEQGHQSYERYVQPRVYGYF